MAPRIFTQEAQMKYNHQISHEREGRFLMIINLPKSNIMLLILFSIRFTIEVRK